MNIKKRSLVMILGLIIGGLFSLMLVGQADTMTQVTGYTGKGVTGESLFGDGSTTLSNAPQVTKITANNVENGCITNRTTQLNVTYSGTITPNTSASKYAFKNLYAEAFNGSNAVIGDPASTNLIPGSVVKTYTFSGSSATQTINLSWSKWQGSKLLIGIRFTPYDVGGNMAQAEKGLALAEFSGDLIKTHQLNPTITGSLYEGSTVIKGKGTIAGDTITADDDGNSSTTVGSDLSYTLNLKGDLTGKNQVNVVESNTAGDRGTATADVLPALTIGATNQSLDLYPDDIDTLKSMSDSDVVDWLVKKAGLTSTDPNNNNSSDGITFDTKSTDLGTKVAALAMNGQLTVPIYAKNADNTSKSLTLTLTRLPGSLSFKSSPAVGFGTLTIPTHTQYFAPTDNWDIKLTDTRASGSEWALMASAKALTDGTHTFKGGLIYRDGSTQTSLDAGSVKIASGQRQAGTTTTDVTSDWSSTKGIVLEALPGVYAGTYQTTVDWTLSDTP